MKTIISSSRTQALWNSQKYFFYDKAMINATDLFVSVGLLCALKFNKKTIRNGIDKNKSHQSIWWGFFIDLAAIFVNWSTIPANSINKLGLPRDSLQMLGILRENELYVEETFKSQSAKTLKARLYHVYNHYYPKYMKYYLDFLSMRDRIRHAKSHALIEEVITLKKEKWSRAMIFEAYRQIIIEEIASGNDPVLDLGNSDYFWKKISSNHPIRERIVSRSKGVPRDYKVKLTGPIRAFIRNQLRKENRLTYPAIVRAVKKKFKVDIDVSSVKKFKINRQIKNLVEFESNGLSHSRNNSMPKLQKNLVSSPGEQFMGDFYQVQFYVRTMDGDIVIIVSYVIIDVFSKKIVGWALGRSTQKNRETIALEAFRMAFTENCWMPEQIIIDNDPYYRSRNFKVFKRKMQNAGVVFPPTPGQYPLYRAEMESSLAAFQLAVCSEKDGFFGADKRSRRSFKTGNPSQELIDKMWRQKDKLPSEAEFPKLFATMVMERNTNFYESAA